MVRCGFRGMLSVLTSLVLVVGLVPTGAYAGEGDSDAADPQAERSLTVGSALAGQDGGGSDGQLDLSGANVTMPDEPRLGMGFAYHYTGEAIDLRERLELGGEVLVRDTDYTIACYRSGEYYADSSSAVAVDPVDVGDYVAVYTGRGRCVGGCTANFSIVMPDDSYDLANTEAYLPDFFVGEMPECREFDVSAFNEYGKQIRLYEGSDFEFVRYEVFDFGTREWSEVADFDGTVPGLYRAVIAPTEWSRYHGVGYAEFSVKDPLDLKNVQVEWASDDGDAVFAATGDPAQPVDPVRSVTLNGRELVRGVDYKLSYCRYTDWEMRTALSELDGLEVFDAVYDAGDYMALITPGDGDGEAPCPYVQTLRFGPSGEFFLSNPPEPLASNSLRRAEIKIDHPMLTDRATDTVIPEFEVYFDGEPLPEDAYVAKFVYTDDGPVDEHGDPTHPEYGVGEPLVPGSYDLVITPADDCYVDSARAWFEVHSVFSLWSWDECATFALERSIYRSSGAPVKPSVAVKAGDGVALSAGKDYELKYRQEADWAPLDGAPSDVGEYEVCAEGLGAYSGRTEWLPFRIVDFNDLANAEVVVEPLRAMSGDGGSFVVQHPKITVRLGGEEFEASERCDVLWRGLWLPPGSESYDWTAVDGPSDPSEPYALTISANPEKWASYHGEYGAQYQLEGQIDLGALLPSMPHNPEMEWGFGEFGCYYTGNPIDPQERLEYEGEPLVRDVDYTVASYRLDEYNADPATATPVELVDVGSYMIVFTGKGGFTGLQSCRFDIVTPHDYYDLANIGVWCADFFAGKMPQKFEFEAEMYNEYGKPFELTEGVDFKLVGFEAYDKEAREWSEAIGFDGTVPGRYRAVLEGMDGICHGTGYAEFSVKDPLDLKNAEVEWNSDDGEPWVAVTGDPTQPVDPVRRVTLNGRELVRGVDYKLSYCRYADWEMRTALSELDGLEVFDAVYDAGDYMALITPGDGDGEAPCPYVQTERFDPSREFYLSNPPKPLASNSLRRAEIKIDHPMLTDRATDTVIPEFEVYFDGELLPEDAYVAKFVYTDDGPVDEYGDPSHPEYGVGEPLVPGSYDLVITPADDCYVDSARAWFEVHSVFSLWSWDECATFALERSIYRSSGAPVKPSVAVKAGDGVALSAGKDYELKYRQEADWAPLDGAPSAPGDYEVCVQGISPYHGYTEWLPFKIVDSGDVAAAEAACEKAGVAYDEAKTPAENFAAAVEALAGKAAEAAAAQKAAEEAQAAAEAARKAAEEKAAAAEAARKAADEKAAAAEAARKAAEDAKTEAEAAQRDAEEKAAAAEAAQRDAEEKAAEAEEARKAAEEKAAAAEAARKAAEEQAAKDVEAAQKAQKAAEEKAAAAERARKDAVQEAGIAKEAQRDAEEKAAEAEEARKAAEEKAAAAERARKDAVQEAGIAKEAQKTAEDAKDDAEKKAAAAEKTAAAAEEKAAASLKANTMTVKAKTVKAKSSKKKTFKKSKAFKVKNAKGAVTFAKLKGNAKISVSSKGKVTVKKGLRAGKTYRVKVLVFAKGGDVKGVKYAPAMKTVTLKVKVAK